MGNNVFDMVINSTDFVTVDFINYLDRSNNDEIVSIAAWSSENPAIASLVGGSPAVDAGGRYASAKFSAAGEGVTRVLVTATTSNPAASPVEYIYIRVYTPPSGL